MLKKNGLVGQSTKLLQLLGRQSMSIGNTHIHAVKKQHTAVATGHCLGQQIVVSQHIAHSS